MSECVYLDACARVAHEEFCAAHTVMCNVTTPHAVTPSLRADEKTSSELAKYLSMLVRKGDLRVAEGAYSLAE